MIVRDLGGGGQWIAPEMRKSKQLIRGVQVETTTRDCSGQPRMNANSREWKSDGRPYTVTFSFSFASIRVHWRFRIWLLDCDAGWSVNERDAALCRSR